MIRRREFVAGLVLLLGFVYLAFEFLAAAAWTDPPYDWARNYISDLGYSGCGAPDRDFCSPRHVLMNVAFLVQGTVFGIGAVLVTGLALPAGKLRTVVRALLLVSAVGTFFVGVFHLSPELFASGLGPLHFLAATLAIGPGNAGVLALGIALVRQAEWRGYAIALVVISVLGLVGAVLLVLRQDLGLGIGLVERVAVYPLNTWTVGTGVGLLVSSVAPGIRDRLRARADASPRVDLEQASREVRP